MSLYHRLRQLWRNLRNLDRLESSRQALFVAADLMRQAQTELASTREQHAATRVVLAATMRDRDMYEDALDNACHELATMKSKSKHERKSARLWLTRCTQTQIGSN